MLLERPGQQAAGRQQQGDQGAAVGRLPIVLPLVAAALSILTGRSRPTQRVIGLTTLAALVVISVLLLVEVDRVGMVVTEAGDRPAPLGITLVADRFAAVLLVVAEITLFAVLVYAIGEPGAERNHVGFQSAYLILAAGIGAASAAISSLPAESRGTTL